MREDRQIQDKETRSQCELKVFQGCITSTGSVKKSLGSLDSIFYVGNCTLDLVIHWKLKTARPATQGHLRAWIFNGQSFAKNLRLVLNHHLANHSHNFSQLSSLHPTIHSSSDYRSILHKEINISIAYTTSFYRQWIETYLAFTYRSWRRKEKIILY